MTMKALLFKDGLRLINDCSVPLPADDEALIRVTHAGICSTDLEIIKGYMGFSGIPGHEFVGVVEESGESGLIGSRVVGEINLGCRNCSLCAMSMQNHCPERSVIGILKKDGVFAEYVTLPADNLHIIPDTVSDEEAVFIEPLAAAFRILEQVDLKPEDRVCILGDGKLGILIGQVLSLTGCGLTVVGKHAGKLSILKDMGIPTAGLDGFDAKGFDVVIDSTGSRSGISTALDIVRPCGTVVLKTTVAEPTAVDLNRIVVNEITLTGSRCGPFDRAIEALASKTVNVMPLISGVFPLDEGIRAFEYAARGDVLKVILKI
jgi:threonine dehydrogenase-like Zn-dependent dehydrogenase